MQHDTGFTILFFNKGELYITWTFNQPTNQQSIIQPTLHPVIIINNVKFKTTAQNKMNWYNNLVILILFY